ncbi:hypothetical protein, partial [Escherichia coli]|uniref:hypothetical protein n=1 Tax=Escherichia coli TaxID=562 RepID=UPI0035AE7A60
MEAPAIATAKRPCCELKPGMPSAYGKARRTRGGTTSGRGGEGGEERKRERGEREGEGGREREEKEGERKKERGGRKGEGGRERRTKVRDCDVRTE